MYHFFIQNFKKTFIRKDKFVPRQKISGASDDPGCDGKTNLLDLENRCKYIPRHGIYIYIYILSTQKTTYSLRVIISYLIQ